MTGKYEWLKYNDLSEIKQAKKQFEDTLVYLAERIKDLEGILKKQEEELKQLDNKLKPIEISNNLIDKNKELGEIKHKLLKQGNYNSKFEAEIGYKKYKKYELEDRKEIISNQIKKTKNSIWKRFLIRITCGLYNPIVKLEKLEKKLTLDIKDLSDLLEVNTSFAKKLSEEYMGLEERRDSITENIDFNKKELSKISNYAPTPNWENINYGEKEKIKQNVKELKIEQENKLKQRNATVNQLKDKKQQQEKKIEEYQEIVKKYQQLYELLPTCNIDHCTEAAETKDNCFNAKAINGNNNNKLDSNNSLLKESIFVN